MLTLFLPQLRLSCLQPHTSLTQASLIDIPYLHTEANIYIQHGQSNGCSTPGTVLLTHRYGSALRLSEQLWIFTSGEDCKNPKQVNTEIQVSVTKLNCWIGSRAKCCFSIRHFSNIRSRFYIFSSIIEHIPLILYTFLSIAQIFLSYSIPISKIIIHLLHLSNLNTVLHKLSMQNNNNNKYISDCCA